MTDLEKRLRGCPCVCHHRKGQRCPCCDSCVEAADYIAALHKIAESKDAILGGCADTLAAVREWAETEPPHSWGHQPLYLQARQDVLAILDRSNTDVEVGT